MSHSSKSRLLDIVVRVIVHVHTKEIQKKEDSSDKNAILFKKCTIHTRTGALHQKQLCVDTIQNQLTN